MVDEKVFEKIKRDEIFQGEMMPTPMQKDEWEHKPLNISDMETVPKAKLILTLDRAQRSEEKFETVVRTMNSIITEKCDLDVFHKKVYYAWIDLKIRYFSHLITNEERIEAIRSHLNAPDVGSKPWLDMLHEIVYVGAAQSQGSGLVRETSKSEVPG